MPALKPVDELLTPSPRVAASASPRLRSLSELDTPNRPALRSLSELDASPLKSVDEFFAPPAALKSVDEFFAPTLDQLAPRLKPVDELFAAPAPSSPTPANALSSDSTIGYRGLLNSIVSPEARAYITSKILGHRVPVPTDQPADLGSDLANVSGLASIVALAKEAARAVPDVARDLVTEPAATLKGAAQGIGEGLNTLTSHVVPTAIASIPDIVRGLRDYPVETMRGGLAGLTEGTLNELTPANLLTLLAGTKTGRDMIARGFRRSPTSPAAYSGVLPRDVIIEQTAKPAEHLPPQMERPAVRTVPTTTPATPFAARVPIATDIPERLGSQMPPGVERYMPNSSGATTAGTTVPNARIPYATPSLTEPSPVRGSLAGRAPTLLESLQGALDDIRREPASAGTLPPEPGITPSGREGAALSSGRPGVTADRYDEITTRPVSAITEPLTGKPAPEADRAVTQSLDRGDLHGAADVIGQRAVQSVQEIARDARAYYGSYEAGKMLNPEDSRAGQAAIKRLAPGPSRIPLKKDLADLDARYRYLLSDQSGAISPRAVAATGGGIAGALYGGTQGSTDEDKARNALLGGAAGVLLPLAIARLRASASPVESTKNYLFSSMLLRPQSIMRAWLGGIGGAATAVADLAMSGDVDRATALMREITNTRFVKGIGQALRDPRSAAMHGYAGQAPALGTGAVYDAVNEPMMRAMLRVGIPHDVAMRYTLAGTPRTPFGQTIVRTWNQYFLFKMLGDMFPRMGAQVLEHAIERSPVALLDESTLKGFGLNGLNTDAMGRPASRDLVKRRVALGGATVGGAYLATQSLPAWAQPYAVALTGPLGLAAGAGFAAGNAKQAGHDASEQINAGIVDAANHALPFFPPFGLGNAITRLPSMFVPGALGDLARARDPYDRQSGGMIGQVAAKIPGLRETLPVKPPLTNIVGQPLEDRSSPVKRFLTYPTRNRAPYQGVPAPIVRELQRLGVTVDAPPYDRTIRIGRRVLTIPPDVAERARETHGQFIVPTLNRLLASPVYQRATDPRKRQLLESAIRRARAFGARAARSQVRAGLQLR